MLVLSRKRGDKLVIGENITITVQKIKGDQVQLGIDAPRHVRVLRSELEPNEPPPAEQSGASDA